MKVLGPLLLSQVFVVFRCPPNQAQVGQRTTLEASKIDRVGHFLVEEQRGFLSDVEGDEFGGEGVDERKVVEFDL